MMFASPRLSVAQKQLLGSEIMLDFENGSGDTPSLLLLGEKDVNGK